MRKNNPRGEGRIFRAWCGPEYIFILGKDRKLHTKPHRDPWLNYKLLEDFFTERYKAREASGHQIIKEEYFGQVFQEELKKPEVTPPRSSRMTVSKPPLYPTCFPRMDWDN